MDGEVKTVKVVNSLQGVYADASIKKQEKRLEQLRERFKQQYNSLPKYMARAPGRVNIIGEHIDYCGYSVLPAAIEQDFIIAFTPFWEGEDAKKIQIANIDKDMFPSETLSTDPY